MKTAVVNSNKLFDKKKNPTFCLSALRGTGECHRCDYIAKEVIHTELKEVLSNLKCIPNISNDNMMVLQEYDLLLQQKIEVQDKIDLIRKRLSLNTKVKE